VSSGGGGGSEPCGGRRRYKEEEAEGESGTCPCAVWSVGVALCAAAGGQGDQRTLTAHRQQPELTDGRLCGGSQAVPNSVAEMSKQQKHQLLAWHSQGKELPPAQQALVEAIKSEYIEAASGGGKGRADCRRTEQVSWGGGGSPSARQTTPPFCHAPALTPGTHRTAGVDGHRIDRLDQCQVWEGGGGEEGGRSRRAERGGEC
jgi:hypothetical protein